MIELINAAAVPSSRSTSVGCNASTGEVPGVAVRATATVTFGAREGRPCDRPGPLPRRLGPHRADRAAPARARALARPASALLEVPRKHRGSTKYTAGSVLVVGGSRGLTGAPILAARAAFRADAGYVAVAAPESTLPVLETALLEVVKRPLPED